MGRRKSKSSSQRHDTITAMRSNDDASIGSALSLKDQFDILVPVKIKKERPSITRALTSSGERDDGSDVSSITTDEHKKMLKYFYNTRAQRLGMCTPTPSTSWCCWNEMGATSNGNNNSNNKKNEQQTATTVVGKKKKKSRSHHHGHSNVALGHPLSVDKTCDVSRSQYSLFDALSEEEEDDDEAMIRSATTDDPADSPIKRKRSWRVSIRKKMPWSKK